MKLVSLELPVGSTTLTRTGAGVSAKLKGVKKETERVKARVETRKRRILWLLDGIRIFQC